MALPIPKGPLAARFLDWRSTACRAGPSSPAWRSSRTRAPRPGAPATARRRVSSHWLDARGNPIVWDGSATALPPPVAPGERVRVELEVQGRSRPGRTCSRSTSSTSAAPGSASSAAPQCRSATRRRRRGSSGGSRRAAATPPPSPRRRSRSCREDEAEAVALPRDGVAPAARLVAARPRRAPGGLRARRRSVELEARRPAPPPRPRGARAVRAGHRARVPGFRAPARLPVSS